MKTLVIHPEDETTDFLSVIYEGTDWTIITDSVSKKILKDSIKEHDRIIMLGHGTEDGLMYNECRMMVDSSYVYLLREKYCIWCNADKFVEKYDIKGIYTGMIISEYMEALMFSVPGDYDVINESNKDFANAMKLHLDSPNFLIEVKDSYDSNLPLYEFNRSRIYCNKII